MIKFSNEGKYSYGEKSNVIGRVALCSLVVWIVGIVVNVFSINSDHWLLNRLFYCRNAFGLPRLFRFGSLGWNCHGCGGGREGSNQFAFETCGVTSEVASRLSELSPTSCSSCFNASAESSKHGAWGVLYTYEHWVSKVEELSIGSVGRLGSGLGRVVDICVRLISNFI